METKKVKADTLGDGDECRLLPEFPDDVTWCEIVPRLDWRTCYLMSAVNRSWRQANQNRQIYDVRARSPSTDRHFLISHIDEGFKRVISLYSMRDNSSRKLPEFPYRQEHNDGGLPRCCTLLSLEGKIYVLGGLHGNEFRDRLDGDMMDVCVLDVAGQREWQICASMPQPRVAFEFGVMDGKIYVFGGFHEERFVPGSVVYDPKTDVWSSASPMTYRRSLRRVVVPGDEAEKWKVLERFEYHHMREFFTVQGKLYRIKINPVHGILVDNFDGHGNRSTTRVQLLSFFEEGVEVSMAKSGFMQVCPLEDGSGEILVMCINCSDPYLFKSAGFGSSSKLLPCHRIDMPFHDYPDPDLDPDLDLTFKRYIILPFQL